MGIIIWAIIVYRFTQSQEVANATWLAGLYAVIAGISGFFFSGGGTPQLTTLFLIVAISTVLVYGWLRLLWRYKYETAKYWAIFIIGGTALFLV